LAWFLVLPDQRIEGIHGQVTIVGVVRKLGDQAGLMVRLSEVLVERIKD